MMLILTYKSLSFMCNNYLLFGVRILKGPNRLSIYLSNSGLTYSHFGTKLLLALFLRLFPFWRFSSPFLSLLSHRSKGSLIRFLDFITGALRIIFQPVRDVIRLVYTIAEHDFILVTKGEEFAPCHHATLDVVNQCLLTDADTGTLIGDNLINILTDLSVSNGLGEAQHEIGRLLLGLIQQPVVTNTGLDDEVVLGEIRVQCKIISRFERIKRLSAYFENTI